MNVASIQSLADREEIRTLRHRFAHGVDKRDWGLVQSVFVEVVDADLSQIGGPKGLISRDSLVGLFQHAFRRAEIRTQQIYSGFLVEVAGDEAVCHSYLHGHHWLQGASGGDVFEIRAEYVDRLIRTSEGWRIAGTTLNVTSVLGNSALVA